MKIEFGELILRRVICLQALLISCFGFRRDAY